MSMAGSAFQVILPLALLFWLMRRSGMMGVSYLIIIIIKMSIFVTCHKVVSSEALAAVSGVC